MHTHVKTACVSVSHFTCMLVEPELMVTVGGTRRRMTFQPWWAPKWKEKGLFGKQETDLGLLGASSGKAVKMTAELCGVNS